MKKILRIGSIKDGARLMDIFCKVELTDGKLSISGVEGPKSNGDCVGSCGQIDMHLRDQQDEIIPADGWDASKLRRFFEVWQEWHLNDMRPACKHQTGPEWTSKDVSIYHFRLTDEASKMQRNAKDAALCALKKRNQKDGMAESVGAPGRVFIQAMPSLRLQVRLAMAA